MEWIRKKRVRELESAWGCERATEEPFSILFRQSRRFFLCFLFRFRLKRERKIIISDCSSSYHFNTITTIFTIRHWKNYLLHTSTHTHKHTRAHTQNINTNTWKKYRTYRKKSLQQRNIMEQSSLIRGRRRERANPPPPSCRLKVLMKVYYYMFLKSVPICSG